MKIRTIKYIIKEGFVNIYKNKLMSLASFSVVFTSLFVFGVFFMVVFNLSINAKALKQQPHLRVVCDENLADFEVEQIGRIIEESGYANKVDYKSKDNAFEKLEDMLGDDADILDIVGDEGFLSASYIIELKNPEMSEIIAGEFRELHGVIKVEYSQKSISIVTAASKWVRAVSIVLFLILFVVTIFIISNTIKLTIYARRKEINIMKYVGATDWFIRWPFIVEGILIGVLGAVAVFVLTGYGYRGLEGKANIALEGMGIGEMLRVATINEIGFALMMFYSVLGVLVGALGSALSLKRHLKV